MTTNIKVGALFRDSQVWHNRYIGQVQRYFRQIDEQRTYGTYKIDEIVASEGDSKDSTWEALQEEQKHRPNLKLIKMDGSNLAVQSTGGEERIKELSRLANEVLEQIQDADYILWSESDLIWPNEHLILSLLNSFNEVNDLGVVAPLIFLENEWRVFYDTYIFRSTKDILWQNQHPWIHNFYEYDKYIPMNSVGSCTLIKGEAIRNGARFGNTGFVDLCQNVRDLGLKVVANRSILIYHPNKNGYIQGRRV